MDKATRRVKSSVKTERKQKPAHLYKPGQSGNPRGRPPGARNRATLALEALMEERLESMVGAIVEKAVSGHIAAARLVMDRLMPVAKPSTVTFELPEITCMEDVAAASTALMKKVAAGDTSAEEAILVQRLLDRHVEILAAAGAAAEKPAPAWQPPQAVPSWLFVVDVPPGMSDQQVAKWLRDEHQFHFDSADRLQRRRSSLRPVLVSATPLPDTRPGRSGD